MKNTMVYIMQNTIVQNVDIKYICSKYVMIILLIIISIGKDVLFSSSK